MAVNAAVTRRSGDPEHALRSTRLGDAGVLWLSGARVLVVDDSEINREVAARILAREGALVREAGSATEALDLLRVAPGDVDIVLMDVQMPGMDGYEATRRLRADPGLSGLPVIALTAGALLAERQRALEAGMDDFVSKPLDPDGLIRTVRCHVERVRRAPLPVCPRDAAVPQPQACAWPDIDGIDRVDAARRLGDDADLFVRLLDRLFLEFDDLMALPVHSPPDAAGRRDLAARAHKLRGSAGMLGAREVQDLARQVEGGLGAGAAAVGDAVAQPVDALLEALAGSLHRLHSASATVRTRTAQRAAARSAQPATPITAEARADLAERLRFQDLSALDRFQQLAPGLQADCGAVRFEQLRSAIEDLRFAQALALLHSDSENG